MFDYFYTWFSVKFGLYQFLYQSTERAGPPKQGPYQRNADLKHAELKALTRGLYGLQTFIVCSAPFGKDNN